MRIEQSSDMERKQWQSKVPARTNSDHPEATKVLKVVKASKFVCQVFCTYCLCYTQRKCVQCVIGGTNGDREKETLVEHNKSERMISQ